MLKHKLALLSILAIMYICVGAMPLLAEDVPTGIQSTDPVVQSIPPEQGADRINAALGRIYVSLVKVIPNGAMIAIVIGAIISIFAAAFGLSKLLKVSVAGVGVIVIMVIIAYAAPFIASVAKGIGEGL